jgi:hypothetical protein
MTQRRERSHLEFARQGENVSSHIVPVALAECWLRLLERPRHPEAAARWLRVRTPADPVRTVERPPARIQHVEITPGGQERKIPSTAFSKSKGVDGSVRGEGASCHAVGSGGRAWPLRSGQPA